MVVAILRVSYENDINTFEVWCLNKEVILKEKPRFFISWFVE